MIKRMRWALFIILSLFSPVLLAVGLGGAVVQSYLDQPLDVRVELITQSEEELQSITAGLASAEDFQLLGLSRTAITVPLAFEVVTDADRPYIRITSDLGVNEPVIQVLVEIVWASGRMLREYTLFLDPPTIDSAAPPVVVRPAPARTELVEEESTTVAPIQKATEPREEIAEAPAVATPSRGTDAEQPDVPLETEPTAEPVIDDAPATEDEPVVEDEPVAEEGQVTEDEPEQDTQPADDRYAEDEVYGPVARGETLWGIARDFSRGTGYSINQTMLALQRKNPEAFIRGNINSLKRGAILRLPSYNELGALTTREALLEVVRQEEELRTGVRSVAPDFDTPTVAESGDYQDTVEEAAPETEYTEDDGHLELVPPAEEESPGLEATEQDVAQDGAVESLREELSRTEEELVNARQENTYLTERIKELEAEALAREEQAATIEDPDLANLETSLAEERAKDQAEPPLAITPGGEEQAWYAGKTPLILGAALVLIALFAWLLRRRSSGIAELQETAETQAVAGDMETSGQTLESEGETVIQGVPEPELEAESEAEPEPEVQAEPEPEPEHVIEPEPEPEPEPESEPEHGTEPEPGPEPRPFPHIPYSEDEAPTVVQQSPEVEDEPASDDTQDDDDPEIKLDLARAYLSLGDKEASRSMLEEVLKSGNEAQQAEARQMMEEL